MGCASWTWVYLLVVGVECGILNNEIPKLIIISMDGFRYNYLDKFLVNETNNFHYFIRNGVKAQYIRNAFPTVTYPNHYTMITGLYPESHGIVHNRFYDSHLDDHFWYDNTRDNVDPLWFDVGAEPIYVTNNKAGSNRKSGSVLWPMGIGKVKCIGPDYIIPDANTFNESIPFETRVDRLIKWFTDKNPINLGLLYMHEPDVIAHAHGPDSQEVRDVIKGPLNSVLGYLRKQLEEVGLLDSVNIILTSDHGFTQFTKFINLDDYIDGSWYKEASEWNNHITVNLIPEGGNTERIIQGLEKVTDLNIYRKGSAALQQLHYNDNERIHPIVLVGNEGVVIVNNATKSKITSVAGHGYRPDVRNMSPFFIASGPAFKKGYIAEPFDSVDIYPLMCHILGLTPAPNNGSLDNVKHMLHERRILEISFTTTAASFLVIVGAAVTIAGLFSICTIIHARKKPRFLLPTTFRGAAEGSTQSHKLLNDTDDDDDDDEL